METSIKRPFPWYEIHFLDVGDADCIAIKYKQSCDSAECIVLIDAGNISDADTVKNFLLSRFGKTDIDLAVCTHPDADHKGGFFALMEDDTVNIHQLWLKNPTCYLSDDDFMRMKKQVSKVAACERVYDHPTDSSKNLLALARAKVNSDGSSCVCRNVKCGEKYDLAPLEVVGPSEDYYREVAVGIVANYAELNCTPDNSEYDEKVEISEADSKSVIDVDDDDSPTNQGSIVLYFPVKDGLRMLFSGDASAASLYDVYERCGNKIKGAILKVPHHGSKHNLNSKVIDCLAPDISIISAIGSKKHPNVAIVRYLSKYGDVYLTHKSKGLMYRDYGHKGGAVPLKEKFNPNNEIT